jgi:general secretion pathway protein D
MNKGFEGVMKRWIVGCLVCLVWVFLPVAGKPPGHAARISGENGVVSSAPAKRQKHRSPDIKKKTDSDAPARVNAAQKEVGHEKVDPGDKKSSSAPKAGKRFVTVDFDNVDIGVFIKFISELTGKNFVIDKGVKGKVTIISPREISVKEAYKVFESVLEVHGYTTVPAGNIIKIVPAVEARYKNVETRLREEALSPEDKVVTQLIPLKYASPDDLKKLFAPLISKSSVIVSYPPTRMLIVTDVLSNIKRLIHITRAIDVGGVGEEILVVPLKHAAATAMAKSLNTVFISGPGKAISKVSATQSTIKIVPDERTNALIILASEDDSLKIRRLVKLLDKETPRGTGDIRVYYLQNADAENLTKVLMAIPSKQGEKAEKGKAPVVSKDVQIVADSATNSLVITASKDDYKVLEEVIKKLDIPRAMVYIEALIMEVNVRKDFKLGVEWEGIKDFSYSGKQGGAFAGSSAFGNYKNLGGLMSAQPGLPSGFSMGVIGELIEIGGIKFPNLAAVVQAYQKDTDIHILSTPQILTTDNEEAEVYVGQNLPYITRQETTVAQLDYTMYEYKDVGVSLKITPQINQERFVRLNIYQEVMRLISTEGLQEGRPSTFKRTVQTTVIVKDGNTVVIGGLIGDDTTEVAYTVPCLGNIPLLGWFFRSTSREREKTNLFVFLTPRIIENPAEAREVYQDKRDQIQTIEEGVIKMYKRSEPGPEK